MNALTSTEQRPPANGLFTGGANLAMGLARSTGLSAVKQPITTAALGVSVMWHRPRELVAANLPVKIDFSTPPEEAPGSAAFERLLDERNVPRAESGRLTWLVDGPEFFPEFERRMREARESVDVQIFIFDNDDIAVRYADKLRERAEKVEVRVLFDDLGSAFAHTSPPETPAPAGFVPPADMAAYLKAGSEAKVRRILNPWLVCDHSKLLVFDRKVAFIGGMNIGREYYSEWHDLMVKVEGPVVGTLARDFNRAWKKAGPWGDFALFRTPSAFRKPRPVEGGIPVRVLRTDPAEGRYEILRTTLLAIRAAKKRVWVQTPYLAHSDVKSALEAAARRGVDVRVILPSRGDSTIMDVANLASARGLIQAGAKIYRYPRMTHMKVLVCDDWASVGSANLDTLSMRINRELNLAFSDGGEIRRLVAKVFTPDFRISKRMTLEETQSLLAPLAGILADQL